MHQGFLMCALFILLGSSNLIAQTDDKQWEYLLISEYSGVSFNELGQRSWEFVGTTTPIIREGSTYGETKFIFKRPFDLARINREAELQKKYQEQAKQSSIEFVNLDAIEKQSSQKENEEKAKFRVEQAIKNTKGFSIISVKSSAWFPNANDRRIGGEVIIDGSKELLTDGNKYRAAEVDKFIRRVADEIYKAAELKPQYAGQAVFAPYHQPNQPGVNIKISVVVSYRGATKTLAEGVVQGNWSEISKALN